MEIGERFAALAEHFATVPDVQLPGESARRAFGSDALKVNGSIFAMVTNGRLVVKLPRERVDALIAAGSGAPFGAGKGRPMKEWVSIVEDDEETWLARAQEALTFVRSHSSRR